MADDRWDAPPEWVVATLTAPVRSRAAARAAIMARVREAPRPAVGWLTLRPVPRAWRRRGVLGPTGLLLAVVAFATITLAARFDRARPEALLPPLVTVLGDSVVALSGGTLDSVLRDTLALVEVVVRGPTIRSASLLGHFNGWRRDATPLVADGDGRWRARVLVPRDALALAVLVNDATLLPVRAPSGTRSDSL
jgi:hypothetical protein